MRAGGSAGCRLSATRAASRGVARRFEDYSPEDQDGHGFPSDPYGVSTPRGCSSSGPHPDPKVGDQPPVRFRAPTETCPCSPAPQRHSAELLRADGRPVSRCSLSWAFLPYDTVSDQQTRLNKATDPSVAACHVRGLDTPIATSTTSPPGARSAGASMGLTLQGVLLVREQCPFRGPCPPDVAGRTHPPRGARTEPAAFRALFPRRVRAATSFPREAGRRYLHGLCPYRAFSPSARVIACSHDAGPLVLGWDDVPTRLDLRASRIEWIGLARFRAACSLGVWHLPTVVALRSTSRGAGSWFHLTQDVARYTRHQLRSKLPRGRCNRGS